MQLLRLDWNILFTILNLIVLYLAMRHFLIGPVMGIIEKRRALIDGQLKDARDQKEEAGKLLAQYEKVQKDAGEEAAQIIEKAKSDAGEAYERQIEEARKQAKRIVAEGQKNVELERAKTVQELEGQIAELALAAAAKILMEGGSEEADRMLYERFLTKAGEQCDADGA